MTSMIRIVGDCGHPWYVNPDDLSDDIKAKPLKCPFCECAGAPIDELLDEMKKSRAQERKEIFKARRTKRTALAKKYKVTK